VCFCGLVDGCVDKVGEWVVVEWVGGLVYLCVYLCVSACVYV